MKITAHFLIKCFFAIGMISDAKCFGAEIKGIDLFGSESLTPEAVIQAEPELFEDFLQALRSEKDAAALQAQLSEKLQERFALPYLRASAITYFKEKGKSIYITFDLVESQDISKRLSFRERPSGIFTDPEGLIEAWDLYLKTAIALLEAKEITPGEVKCRAFHWAFGHQHPQLAPFENVFIEGVTKNKQQLIEIFKCSQNDHQRAVIPFLLAYMQDGQELVELLAEGIDDVSSEVRNNVLRVYACIAQDHPELVLPLDQILKAFDFPSTTDRNKVAAILFGLTSHPEFLEKHRDEILRRVSATLLKMLQLKQPNNRDWAYGILKQMSGLNIPQENIIEWKEWVHKAIGC